MFQRAAQARSGREHRLRPQPDQRHPRPDRGLSDATSDEDYLSLMKANLTALRTANGCR